MITATALDLCLYSHSFRSLL